MQKMVQLMQQPVKPISDGIEDEIRELEAEQQIELAENQRAAVLEAVQNGVLVITGGPGTGKTTALNTIIRLFERHHFNIALAAPTGRAAKRLSEATGREAKTIHRLLEYSYLEESTIMSFAKSEEDPLEADVVIIDEMSMVDVFLMNGLLRAILPGTRLILVGDADQLPSVGPGNVLRDIIESGLVKVVKLDQIFRQAQESMIIVNAHRINRGEYPYINQKEKDFYFISRRKPENILQTIKDLCETAAQI